MRNQRMTAILIEFSGGILSNSNQDKANKYLNKLLPSMTAINKDRVKLPTKVFAEYLAILMTEIGD
ncbi:hypothetical protein DFQ28_010445 [Apophysomyces sp. BC1034]|nr:hypothetical protein DFQ29_008958 [Apophysomyces sp. BC1021]KAG0184803.1 hypothetical protein DFQ28_010445 [Apophysomyces sp. BC1034]